MTSRRDIPVAEGDSWLEPVEPKPLKHWVSVPIEVAKDEASAAISVTHSQRAVEKLLQFKRIEEYALERAKR